MLHQANDFLGPILIYGFGVIMAGTPLTILVLPSSIQALASIAVWAVLTFALVMILMVIIFSFPYPLSQTDELKSTGVFILGSLFTPPSALA